MAIHKPHDLHFVSLDGATLTSGGSKSLAKGQIGIFDIASATPSGVTAVSSFSTADKRKNFSIFQGKSPVQATRSAQNAKPYKSAPFKLRDVQDVTVSAPKTTEQKFDQWLVGYDGINEDTALDFEQGDNAALDIILSGQPMGDLGYTNARYVAQFHIDVENDDTRTNQQIVEDLVERIKNYKLINNVPITNFIDVTTVDSTKTAAAGTSYTYSTLTVADLGDSNDLARVQAQYPSYTVRRTDRAGIYSTYTILAPTADVIADYSVLPAQILKDCGDCPAGYTELESGFVYYVTLEDTGSDDTAIVDDLPGFVTGSVVKVKQVNDIGHYTVVVDDELTSGEITTFVTANPTAEVALLGDVQAVCENTTAVETSWVAGDTCTATSETYTIQLKDDECDGSILADLQAAYPDLTIVEGAATGESSSEITLTGTSGTANINIAGVDYLATFNSTLTQTATDFVTTHAAAILAATGAVVTSDAAVITVTDDTTGFPAITIDNATGDLAGTIAAAVLTEEDTEGGCQRIYSTTVVTNIVCEECDPIFNDTFTSEAPAPYNFTYWEKVEGESDAEALMGIRITGKPYILEGSEYLIDEIPFYETSTRIEVAGGYATEVNSSWKDFNKPFNVKLLQKAEDRDHLGYNLRVFEEKSRTHFDGEVRHTGNNFAKAILGEESLLKPRAQYVDYAITIADDKFAQGFSGRRDITLTYHILVEVGRHETVETLVNDLAVAAGLEPVQAFAKN